MVTSSGYVYQPVPTKKGSFGEFLDKAGNILNKGFQIGSDIKTYYDAIRDSANRVSSKPKNQFVTTTSDPSGGGWIVLVGFAILGYIVLKKVFK